MAATYTVKQASVLSAQEVAQILKYWDVEEWKQLSVEQFKQKFGQSEFHLLTSNQANLLSLARVNFDFKIRIGQEVYELAELVSLVATEKMQGYGRQLIRHLRHNLKSRHIDVIGFCEKENRPFYETCHVPIMFGKAKYLREKWQGEWQEPPDDDILNISLSKSKVTLLESLSANNPGYLLFS